MKQTISKVLTEAIKEIDNSPKITEEQIHNLIETPPNPALGDFAFPCFFLSKSLKMSPHEIALEVRQQLGNPPKGISSIQTQGPYVNFFLDRKSLTLNLINEIKKQNNAFGSSTQKNPPKTMIEFSQANTHKAFHVGHIRGTSLGESLARILFFSGERVLRVNYQGDTGMHVAKWIWCYKKYHSREKIKPDEAWIASIYVDAVKRLSKNEKLQKEVDVINQKLETRSDKELNKLWERTRKISLESFEKIYKQLNTHFDYYFFEGDLEKKAKDISLELVKKGIAKEDQGAVIIDLKQYNLGVWVLLRSDGTVLYSSKDLALAEKKFNEYKINRNLYVVGAAQSLHMQQLFKTLELMKFPGAENSQHVSYNEVRLPHGKMSSRTGDNILYSDFLDELIKHTKKGLKKRDKKISKSKLDSRSLAISIAAIKYSMLKQSPNKAIVFNKDEALNFEGDTGPYLLYSYARANSITKKSKNKSPKLSLPEELHPKETELVIKLNQFPETVQRSYTELNPSYIAKYSYELAQTFNEFYHACPVINSKEEPFRISLVNSFKQVLKNSLNLLGIETIDEM